MCFNLTRAVPHKQFPWSGGIPVNIAGRGMSQSNWRGSHTFGTEISPWGSCAGLV